MQSILPRILIEVGYVWSRQKADHADSLSRLQTTHTVQTKHSFLTQIFIYIHIFFWFQLHIKFHLYLNVVTYPKAVYQCHTNFISLTVIKQTNEYTRWWETLSPCNKKLFTINFIIWLRLTRTGNYRIHKFDRLKQGQKVVQIFPI